MLFSNGSIRYLIVIYAILLHFLQGSLMIISPDAGFVTSTSHVREWLQFSTFWLGVFYVLASVFSVVGLLVFGSGSLQRLLTLLPQQLFLTLAAAGAAVAIIDSQFADGVVRSRYFIAADQSPIIIAALLHSVAVIDRRVEILWKRLHSQ